jgi:hypothetical protein
VELLSSDFSFKLVLSLFPRFLLQMDYNGLDILDHWLSYTFDAKIISGEKK